MQVTLQVGNTLIYLTLELKFHLESDECEYEREHGRDSTSQQATGAAVVGAREEVSHLVGCVCVCVCVRVWREGGGVS